MSDQGPGWRNIKTTGLLDVSELQTQLAAKDAEIARLREDMDRLRKALLRVRFNVEEALETTE